LHEFYKWAIREDLTMVDPTAKIIRPRVHPGEPRPADSAELGAALSAAGPQHRCWLLLAALEGMRCQEIAGLSTEDVREQKALLVIAHGKGDKSRKVPLHPLVLDALKALPMPRRGRLFRKVRGGTYTPADLSREFNAFLRSAGVSSNAHSLRHWFGTEFYNSTKDLRMTADMMGHAHISTTAVYTKVDTTKAGEFIRAMTFDTPEPEPEAA